MSPLPELLRTAGLLLALVAPLARPAGADPDPGGDPAVPDLYAPARRWALVVGASDYPERLGRLRFAAGDAERFAGALTGRLGFDPDSVRLMTGAAEDPELRPTAGHVFLQLRRLLADPELASTDLFVFYFAGHGLGLESGDWLLPLDGAIETAEDVGLHVEDIVRELVAAGLSNVLFVVDGCRTGESNSFGRELWDLAGRENLAVVLSCAPGEQSYEDARLGGGVFSHYLVEALGDPEVVDAASGALWASRAAAATRERVLGWTARGFDGPQEPQVWSDPTRDVLLGAQLPGGEDVALVGAFLEGAGELGAGHWLAAAARYAEELFLGDRHEECAELLRAAEQMGELPPPLLYMLADSLQQLGRSAEMAAVQARLIEAWPDSFHALVVLAHDLSGETPAAERARAARRLWAEWPIQSESLALLIAFDLVNGGAPAEARAVVDALTALIPAERRPGAYLRYMRALLDGRFEEGLDLLARAEGLPEEYPGNWRLRHERFGLLTELGRPDEALVVLDGCIEDWPEDGAWRAQRALLRRDLGDREAAFEDARAALALELEPWAVLLAVRAAGLRAYELAEDLQRHLARHPLSWRVALAGAMTLPDGESLQVAVDAARRLAPFVGPWTFEVARVKLERASEAFEADLLPGQAVANLRFEVLDVLVERAADLRFEPEAWALLADLAGTCRRQRQLAELVHLHFGADLEGHSVPPGLLGTLATALLNGGDLEGFRAVVASAAPESSMAASLGWLEAVWLACAGRDTEAAARLEAIPEGPAQLAVVEPWLLALLAARADDPERARELLAGAPEDPADLGFLSRALVGLAREALGDLPAADALFATVLSDLGDPAHFYARVACWGALWRRTPLPERRTLAWVAGRDACANPLAAELTFADAPGIEAFLGTSELAIASGGGELEAIGASLLLTVRPGGRVTGLVEGPGDRVWSFSGSIDAYGNLDADLRGAGRPARVLGKLVPAEVLAEDPLLAEYGLPLLVLDEAARASEWLLVLSP